MSGYEADTVTKWATNFHATFMVSSGHIVLTVLDDGNVDGRLARNHRRRAVHAAAAGGQFALLSGRRLASLPSEATVQRQTGCAGRAAAASAAGCGGSGRVRRRSGRCGRRRRCGNVSGRVVVQRLLDGVADGGMVRLAVRNGCGPRGMRHPKCGCVEKLRSPLL